MPDTPILQTNELSIRGLNKTDFYLLIFDAKWVTADHMAHISQDLIANQINFSIIPTLGNPKEVLHIAQAEPKEGE